MAQFARKIKTHRMKSLCVKLNKQKTEKVTSLKIWAGAVNGGKVTRQTRVSLARFVLHRFSGPLFPISDDKHCFSSGNFYRGVLPPASRKEKSHNALLASAVF